LFSFRLRAYWAAASASYAICAFFVCFLTTFTNFCVFSDNLHENGGHLDALGRASGCEVSASPLEIRHPGKTATDHGKMCVPQEDVMTDIGQFGAIHADDIEELNYVVWPWELVMRQMSLGPLRANLEFLQLDGILINRERWSNRVLATGATPAEFIALAGPCTDRSFKWCGKEVDQSRVACGIDSTEIEFVTPEAADHWVLLIPQGLIVDHLGEETAAEALRQRNIVVSEPRLSRELFTQVERARRIFRGPGGKLADADEVAATQSDLLDSVSTLLIRGAEHSDVSSERRRYQACRKAISLVDDLMHPIEVPELAAVVGVSRRVLERGFQESIGVSPYQYLKRCRLNRLHRKLRSARSPAESVTQLATSLGFTEQGRMAAEYKRMFGELPSTTLARHQHFPDMRLADALAAEPVSSHTE
jgi:AraC family ethanolamine operon transcriptional activator